MSKKSFQKKKLYRAWIREQGKAGKVHDGNGLFVESNRIDSASAAQMCVSGSQHRRA